MPKKSFSKLLSAGLLAGILVVSMAACTGSSSDSASGCTVTKSGTHSDKVKVTGKVGSKPTVKFAKGLSSKTTERTVVTDGDGIPAVDGSTASIRLTAYNATSAKLIDSEGYTASSPAFDLTVSKTDEIAGLYKAVHCATPGTRVVTVVPPVDAFGSSGQSDLGLGAKDSVVFVIDVASVKPPTTVLDKPDSSFPKVSFDSKGAPTITMPKAKAPTDLKIAYLKKGKGAVVQATDTVEVNYTGAIWATGKVFDSSWSRGTPASFPASGVIPGFSKALVGQKVGSELITVIPPAEGYADSPPTGIKATDTLVFVVDIISTGPTPAQ